MEMPIEEKFKALEDEYTHLVGKYLMMKAQYEVRLKADMVAILTEIQVGIGEMDSREHECDFATQWCIDRDIVVEIIQQKINALKEVAKDGD